MPHIIVKLWPGRDDEVKLSLANKIAKEVSNELKVDMGTVSVEFEEVEKNDWREVYKKEIENNSNLYLKPNYKYD
jgi:4-oxalocrotonate tautomerase